MESVAALPWNQRQLSGSWPIYVMTWGGVTLRVLELRSPLLLLDYNLGVHKQIGYVTYPNVRENTYDYVRRSVCAFVATR
jgi:hypothetical protein